MSEDGHLPENADDALLQALGGATFKPDSTVVLPSGRQISGSEAQAFSAAFAPDGPYGRSTPTPSTPTLRKEWWRLPYSQLREPERYAYWSWVVAAFLMGIAGALLLIVTL